MSREGISSNEASNFIFDVCSTFSEASECELLEAYNSSEDSFVPKMAKYLASLTEEDFIG